MGPLYFGLIADGVSDAIAPHSFSGPRTTRKASALLHYPSPTYRLDIGNTIRLSNLHVTRDSSHLSPGLRAPLGLEPSTRLSAALSVVELGPHSVELAVELGGVLLIVVHLDTEGHGREVQHVVIGAGLAYRGQVYRRSKGFGFNLRGVHLGVPFSVFRG